MPICNITEFQELPADLNRRYAQAASAPVLAVQEITGLTATPQQSSAFNKQTCFVRIVADVAIRYTVHPSDTATATSTRLPAEAVEIIGLPTNKSYRISVRTA